VNEKDITFDTFHDTWPNEVIDKVNSALAKYGSKIFFEDISEEKGADDYIPYRLNEFK
jgi:hypothetical protein